MNKIERLEASEKTRDCWNTIFTQNDPFLNPFQPGFIEVLVFYPTYGYHLDENQYTAFCKAIRDIGESIFYISEVEFSGDFFARGNHWKCKMPSHDDYLTIPLVLENTQYSAKGSFGVMISHEDHAVVSGIPEFIESLKRFYPTWKEDEDRIVTDWAEYKELSESEIMRIIRSKDQRS